MFTQPADVVPRRASDAALVGRLLAETEILTPVGALAEVLHWKRSRVTAAVDAPAELAPLVGLRVARSSNRVGVVPGTEASPDDLQAMLRKHLARVGMKRHEARVLYRVMVGELDVAKLGKSERVALGRLVDAGYVEVDEATARLTDDVAFSLSVGAS